MDKKEFKRLFSKYRKRLIERHQIISMFYISGMTKADIARGENVTPQFIGNTIRALEGKFIKWNAKLK